MALEEGCNGLSIEKHGNLGHVTPRIIIKGRIYD